MTVEVSRWTLRAAASGLMDLDVILPVYDDDCGGAPVPNPEAVLCHGEKDRPGPGHRTTWTWSGPADGATAWRTFADTRERIWGYHGKIVEIPPRRDGDDPDFFFYSF